MTVDTFTATGSWLCPAGVTSVDAECWGGGAGGVDTSAGRNAGGGGGGAYSKKLAVPVTPGTTYTVTVAAGAAFLTAGNDSWFGTSGTVLAKGGTLADASGHGGQGGAAASGVGDTKFSGGNGVFSFGGGGGGAGDANNGGNASGGTGGTGGTAGGGNGGNHSANGSTIGGGGGGSSGTGARGEVRITYTVAGAAQTHQMIL